MKQDTRAVEAAADCPDPKNHYFIRTREEVDQSTTVGSASDRMNFEYKRGYRLVQALSHDGEVVFIYEHGFHS